MLARGSELTAHFLTWEYPRVLFLAEEQQEEQQGGGSDCKAPTVPKGRRTALFDTDLTIPGHFAPYKIPLMSL